MFEAEADDDVAAADDELVEPDAVTNTPPGAPATPLLLATAAPVVDVDDFPKSLGKSVVTPINPGIV